MRIANQLDERLTLNQVAQRLDVHIGTVYRWSLSGVRGRRLRTFLIGGRRFVTLADLERFIQSKDSTSISVKDPTRSNAAQSILSSYGIGSPKGKDGAA